jgi:hypothetical protein
VVVVVVVVVMMMMMIMMMNIIMMMLLMIFTPPCSGFNRPTCARVLCSSRSLGIKIAVADCDNHMIRLLSRPPAKIGEGDVEISKLLTAVQAATGPNACVQRCPPTVRNCDILCRFRAGYAEQFVSNGGSSPWTISSSRSYNGDGNTLLQPVMQAAAVSASQPSSAAARPFTAPPAVSPVARAPRSLKSASSSSAAAKSPGKSQPLQPSRLAQKATQKPIPDADSSSSSSSVFSDPTPTKATKHKAVSLKKALDAPPRRPASARADTKGVSVLGKTDKSVENATVAAAAALESSYLAASAAAAAQSRAAAESPDQTSRRGSVVSAIASSAASVSTTSSHVARGSCLFFNGTAQYFAGG